MSVIDTSAWNGHPDFGQVKASGVDLVILKAVDLERGYPVVDSVYYANRTAVRATGLRCGSYLFNGPDSPAAAADYYFSVIDYRPGEYAAVDVENALGVNRWSIGQVLEFCTELIRRGVPGNAILAYMSSSVAHAYDWTPVKRLGVQPWLAQYGSNDGTAQGAPNAGSWGSWALWQYTSVGTVPGIRGLVDRSMINATFASTGVPIAITPPVIPQPILKAGKEMLIVRVNNPGTIKFSTGTIVCGGGEIITIPEGGKPRHISGPEYAVLPNPIIATYNAHVLRAQDMATTWPINAADVTGFDVGTIQLLVDIYCA